MHVLLFTPMLWPTNEIIEQLSAVQSGQTAYIYTLFFRPMLWWGQMGFSTIASVNRLGLQTLFGLPFSACYGHYLYSWRSLSRCYGLFSKGARFSGRCYGHFIFTFVMQECTASRLPRSKVTSLNFLSWAIFKTHISMVFSASSSHKWPIWATWHVTHNKCARIL